MGRASTQSKNMYGSVSICLNSQPSFLPLPHCSSPPLFSAQVQTKTVKEIIEFYYEWKKTSHYLNWKKSYVMDERDFI